MIGVTSVGKTVPMSILRNGEPLEIRPPSPGWKRPAKPFPPWTKYSDPPLQITVADLRQRTAPRLGVDERGVLVTTLDEGPGRERRPVSGRYYPKVTAGKSASQFVELVKELPKGQGGAVLVRRETNRCIWPYVCPSRADPRDADEPNNCLDSNDPSPN